MQKIDIAVIGAGAAGLFAGIWAGRTDPTARVVVFDGAKRIGAKILISGGGRCNVTHHRVDETFFAGSTSAAIRKVLRRYSVEQTVNFFGALGVELKKENTGKLFPVSDRAQTVLDALLKAAAQFKVEILTAHRVRSLTTNGHSFQIGGDWGSVESRKVILATGGKSVPRTGSDGYGYNLAVALGHTLTERIDPALVPFLLDPDTGFHLLSGISAHVELRVESSSGSIQKSFQNFMLLTHFGISGPAVLDISRYYIEAKAKDAGSLLTANWFPGKTAQDVDAELQQLGRSTAFSWLRKRFPDRLAEMFCEHSKVAKDTPGFRLSRQDRAALLRSLTRMILPVTGNRGFAFAEVTAGGVPLKELNLDTMESRRSPNLYLCGEICDVDGRIGGFNFQWAWSSGYVAGLSAASKV